MRATVLLVLAACAGPVRPGVVPKLSERPGDIERRDAILDNALKAAAPIDEKRVVLDTPAKQEPVPYDKPLVPWVKLK